MEREGGDEEYKEKGEEEEGEEYKEKGEKGGKGRVGLPFSCTRNELDLVFIGIFLLSWLLVP